MKNTRQLFSATVLTLAISSISIAGDMWVPGIVNPPPPGSGRVASSTPKVKVTALDTLTETALFLSRSMLSLF